VIPIFSFALGFVAGCFIFDRVWRYLNRMRDRIEKLRDEDTILQKAIELVTRTETRP